MPVPISCSQDIWGSDLDSRVYVPKPWEYALENCLELEEICIRGDRDPKSLAAKPVTRLLGTACHDGVSRKLGSGENPKSIRDRKGLVVPFGLHGPLRRAEVPLLTPWGKRPRVMVAIGERRNLPAAEISLPSAAPSRPSSYQRPTGAYLDTRASEEDATGMRIWGRWSACLQAVKSYKTAASPLEGFPLILECMTPRPKAGCGERSSKQVYASTATPTLLILSKKQGVLFRNFEDWTTKTSSALLS